MSADALSLDAEYLEYGDADDEDLGIIYGVAFCRSCVIELGLPPSGAFLSREKVDKAVLSVTGVCGGCLKKWLDKITAK